MSAAVCYIPSSANSSSQMVRSQNNWEWQRHPPEEEDEEDYGEFVNTSYES